MWQAIETAAAPLGRTIRSVSGRLMLVGALSAAMFVMVSGCTLLYLSKAQVITGDIAILEKANARLFAEAPVLLERQRRSVDQAQFLERGEALNDSRIRVEKLSALMLGLPMHGEAVAIRDLEPRIETIVQLSRDYFFALKHDDHAQASTARRAYSAAVDDLTSDLRQTRDRVVSQLSRALLDFSADGREVQRAIFAAIALALLIVLPMCVLVVTDLTHRMRSVTVAMGDLANGNTDIEISGHDASDEVGDMARALGVFRENAVTVLNHAEEIRRLNAWFDVALNNMAHGLSMFDRDGRLVMYNQKYAELYNLDPAEIRAGMTIDEITAYFVHQVQGSGTCDVDGNADGGESPANETHSEAQHRNMVDWLSAFKERLVCGNDFFHEHTLAGGRAVQVQFRPIEGGGWVDVHQDVTEARRANDRIAHLAQSDGLTDLANRKHFHAVLQRELESIETTRPLAVLWLDLDRFKIVNDTYGHPAGDALIRQVADRLRSIVRAGDIVARLGGDEFAILIIGASDPVRGASRVADRVIDELTKPFRVLGHTVTIGVSVGIAIAPEHGTTPDGLIRNADMALYRAKTTGRGTHVFYEADFERSLLERRGLERDLKRAFGTDQLQLHYQPIVDLASNCVSGVEALMRWQHPRFGFVSPAKFIPLAEEIGLIDELGAWALRVACRDAAALPEVICVAVNLSAAQFARDTLFGDVTSALAANGLQPSRLELEVTEGLLVHDRDQTRDLLCRLREAGVGIALDDFGTGYSSLSYLREFPFSKLKIDRSFVRDLPQENGCEAIIQAVIALAKSIRLQTVAEGVESLDHLMRVKAAGCDMAQGFHFSRAVPMDELMATIDAINHRLTAAA